MRIFSSPKTPFLRDKSANAAMIFGLSLFPLILMGGGAIDFQRVATVRSSLKQAADSAGIVAARNAAAMIGRGQANWANDSQVVGANWFRANSRTITDVSAVTPNVSVTRSGQGVTATVTFTAPVPTKFLRLVGLPSIGAGGSVSATASLPQYANVSLVLDVSPSMAIAATAADMATMKTLTMAQTGTDCAFACHDMDVAAPLSNYQIARNGGVTLRIDIVKRAAQALSAHMATAGVIANQYTLGLYTMSSALRTIVPPTSNFTAVNAAIGAIDFDKMSVVTPTLPPPAATNVASGVLASHYGDTDFGASFTTLDSTVPTVGAGASVLSRKQVTFIVTDGVGDVAVPFNSAVNTTYVYPPIPNFSAGNDWGKLTSPISATLCDTLKNRGVLVGVLYVPYVADPGDPFYQKGVQTNAPPEAVEANLRACASPNLYYEANDLTGLTTGLRTLFDNAAVQTAARLTR